MPFTLSTNESETVEFKQSFQAEVIETLAASAQPKAVTGKSPAKSEKPNLSSQGSQINDKRRTTRQISQH